MKLEVTSGEIGLKIGSVITKEQLLALKAEGYNNVIVPVYATVNMGCRMNTGNDWGTTFTGGQWTDLTWDIDKYAGYMGSDNAVMFRFTGTGTAYLGSVSVIKG